MTRTYLPHFTTALIVLACFVQTACQPNLAAVATPTPAPAVIQVGSPIPPPPATATQSAASPAGTAAPPPAGVSATAISQSAPSPTTPPIGTPVAPTATSAAGSAPSDRIGVPTPALRIGSPAATAGVSPTTSPGPGGGSPVAAGPSPAAGAATLFVDPDRRFSLKYPADLLKREDLSSSLTIFISADRGTFIAVDSYVARGNEYGNTGEGLRNRARDTLQAIYGKPVSETGVIDRPATPWETGVSFTTDLGSKGDALYQQAGRAQGNFRVYGVLIGYKANAETERRPILEAARDTFMPVTSQAIDAGSGRGLTAVWSIGMRSFDPALEPSHWVALFRRDDSTWQKLGHQDLPEIDFLSDQSVRSVAIAPGRTWLLAEGGTGAHAGCLAVLGYDRRALRTDLSHCHSSPGAGYVKDLDGDGRGEVVLNQTDDYIFCYACGVKLPGYVVARWDGSAFQPMGLTPIDTGPADVRSANNQAFDLAHAGLWKDAGAAIDRASAAGGQSPTVTWNRILIRLQNDALREQVTGGPYPLLANVFAGDYTAAVALMRRIPPARLFGASSPTVAGTVAETSVDALAEAINHATTLVIGAQPDLAGAYFLRGWAAALTPAGRAAALADVEKASRLAPADQFYAQAAAVLKSVG